MTARSYGNLVVLGTHKTIDLDKHRGTAAQKATDLRRLAAVEATISRLPFIQTKSPFIQISAENHAANRKHFDMSSFKKFSSEHTAPNKDAPRDKPKGTPKSDQPTTKPDKALAISAARARGFVTSDWPVSAMQIH